jgi:hypothetical protein
VRQGKLLNTRAWCRAWKKYVSAAPLLVIQQFLGHSDPKTTLRYIRRAEEVATRAYRYNTLPI